MNASKINIAISRCLLGDKVRYNGTHKFDQWISNTLGQFVTFIPVCPEVEFGMGIPREPIQLEIPIASPQIVSVYSNKNYTQDMLKSFKPIISNLLNKSILGFILKSKSPSCGIYNIPIFNNHHSIVANNGMGLFARMVHHQFPLYPLIDEHQIHQPTYRESFFNALFICDRFRKFINTSYDENSLMAFHFRHKSQLQSHHWKSWDIMNQLIQNQSLHLMKRVYIYQYLLIKTILQYHATTYLKSRVLFDLMAWIDNRLLLNEKNELIHAIDQYSRHNISLQVPVNQLRHLALKYDHSDLQNQYFLFSSQQDILFHL